MRVCAVLQPGNHDVGQNPGREDVERYKARWGDDYFSFWVGGVLYVAINSQYFMLSCANDEARAMAAEQDTWLEAELGAAASAGAKHVIILSHVTPFMGREDEPQGTPAALISPPPAPSSRAPPSAAL